MGGKRKGENPNSKIKIQSGAKRHQTFISWSKSNQIKEIFTDQRCPTRRPSPRCSPLCTQTRSWETLRLFWWNPKRPPVRKENRTPSRVKNQRLPPRVTLGCILSIVFGKCDRSQIEGMYHCKSTVLNRTREFCLFSGRLRKLFCEGFTLPSFLLALSTKGIFMTHVCMF